MPTDRRSEASEMWIRWRMEKISWLDEWGSSHWTLLGKVNIDGLATFKDMMNFCMKLQKAEREVNQKEGEEFKCYKIWQMITWLCCTQTRHVREFEFEFDTFRHFSRNPADSLTDFGQIWICFVAVWYYF